LIYWTNHRNFENILRVTDSILAPTLEPKHRLANDPAYVVLLGALTMLPPLSIDIILPGLPLIARALQAPGSTSAWSISAFVLAFSLGQLAVGPLSDRFGRRPALMLGISAFVLFSLACAIATNIHVLIALRFLQGLGACAGTVSARAIVADIAPDGAHATKLQAYVSATNSVAPIIAPLLGAGLLAFWNWRWLFGALAMLGCLLLVAVIYAIRETAPSISHSAFAGYRQALRESEQRKSAILGFLLFGGYFAFIGSSSLILEGQLHASRAAFAFVFAINACSTMAGSLTAGRFAQRFRPEELLKCGIHLTCVAGVAACAFNSYLPSITEFTLVMTAFAFCYGLTIPSVFGIALSGARRNAGIASALLGSAQMLGGALGSAVAAAVPLPPAAGTGCVAAVCAIGAWILCVAFHPN
jgi:MFS transporter, DHA1 family, multidrug resistance protein